MVFTSSFLWIFIFLTFVSCFFFVLFSYSAKPRSRPVAAKGPPRDCLKRPLREPKGPKDFSLHVASTPPPFGQGPPVPPIRLDFTSPDFT